MSTCVTCGDECIDRFCNEHCAMVRQTIELDTCRRIAALMRRERDLHRESAKMGGPTAHRMGDEMAAALLNGYANWIETLAESPDWKRGT